MKTASKWTLIALALMLGASTSMATLYTFGTDNDGLAGFTTSATNQVATATVTWETTTNSVKYKVADVVVGTAPEGGTDNGSLLISNGLTRADGQTYTMTGVVTLTGGYAADNNRVGMYLFSTNSSVGIATTQQGLYFLYNSDGGTLQLINGMGGTTITNMTIGPDLNVFGKDLIFSADISYRDVAGTLYMDITGTLTKDGNDYTIGKTDLLASSFGGDYFGFATRARERGVATGTPLKVGAWEMDYKSFEIIPEPTTFSMIALMGGVLLFIRRYTQKG
jgi:hypothetical protein